ncbi:AAA family ATPase [Acidithiobacillus sp. 'AMD consortium']|uniref:replicative DNA helicase n=1 Tax=Acidithiobacillus sp. 'AMD consortium' TaxID=2614801 RepID=UPI00124E5155|nr:DnaB-like helicase C-terminal domain-containing protein [Acidithiobacillus sp. 'AMD consortium']QFG77806.1 AAA family ATPase [Acidithiobacillus sp. 'AMD consortium']
MSNVQELPMHKPEKLPLLQVALAEQEMVAEKAINRLKELGITTAANSGLEMLLALQKWQEGTEKMLSSGLPDLDKSLGGGFEKGQLIIVAARPSAGKSILAMNIAESLATETRSSLFLSLEMSSVALQMRLACKNTGIKLERMKTKGELKMEDFSKISIHLMDLQKKRLYLTEKSNISVDGIIERIIALQAVEPDLGMVAIDYLQLISTSKKSNASNRQEEVSQITRQLKIASQELQVPILLACQLNRGTESRTDKRPQLGDLRESGAIEQDADIVLGIYREELYYRDKEEVKGIAEICVLKNRDGETGSAMMKFDGPGFAFRNYAPETYDRY